MARGRRHHHHGHGSSCYDDDCKRAAYARQCQEEHLSGIATFNSQPGGGTNMNTYHGYNGQMCYESGHGHPVGGMHFEDDMPNGKHSHAKYSITNGNATPIWHRHQGVNMPGCNCSSPEVWVMGMIDAYLEGK